MFFKNLKDCISVYVDEYKQITKCFFLFRGENVMEKIIGDQIQILTKKLKFYTSFREFIIHSRIQAFLFIFLVIDDF